MVLKHVARLCQKCASGNPVLVLGSGASMPHGIKGMRDLALWLKDDVQPEGDREVDAWTLVRTALANGDHLEAALEKNAIPENLLIKVVRSTWNFIAKNDWDLLLAAVEGNVEFPLKTLLAGLFRSTNRTIHIITTNYDRVAEYAADSGGFIHHTGFLPGYLRRSEGAETLSYRQGPYHAKTLTLWKVHGSLDWFLDPSGRVISVPLMRDLPDSLTPMIVTPGISKYQRTQYEPFRSAMQGADRALQGANAIICIGYGFRDDHIHPKLITRCKVYDAPILVAAKELTSEAKEFLQSNAGRHFIALEDHLEGTKAYSKEFPEGEVIPGKYWNLANLNELIGF